MSLNYFFKKVNFFTGDSLYITYMTLLIILVGLLGFGLGRLSKLEERKSPINIISPIEEEVRLPIKVSEAPGKYVGSKAGNSYYLPWCLGVKKIKDSNKIWFNTKEEALLAGYKKASTCKGL